MSEWISVEAGMPKYGPVIARYIKGYLGVPTAHYEMAFFEPPLDDGSNAKHCGWLFWRDNKQISYPVTHWKLFDDAIKEDGEDFR